MSDWTIIIAAVVALVCAGYLLVRYEILDVRDAAAGGAFIAAVALIWRMVTRAPRRRTPSGNSDDAVNSMFSPEPPSSDVDEIINQSGEQLSEEPPDDIHQQLHDALSRTEERD